MSSIFVFENSSPKCKFQQSSEFIIFLVSEKELRMELSDSAHANLCKAPRGGDEGRKRKMKSGTVPVRKTTKLVNRQHESEKLFNFLSHFSS